MTEKPSFNPGPPPELKDHYRSGIDELSRDFFGPCLKSASLYRRAAGYFSTSALLSWTDGLLRLAQDGELTVKLVASPELSQVDASTLKSLRDPETLTNYRTKIVDRVIEEILKFLDDPSDAALRAEVFAWLIANERLQIRFAFPEHIEDAGMFHEKIGIFDFADGSRVAFTGSANETISGHRRNYESIDVYRSWSNGEGGRVSVKSDQFDEAWSNRAPGLAVLAPSDETLERLRARAPHSLRHSRENPLQNKVREDPRWAHQDEAVEAIVNQHAGILEMATGTGKTRTALKLLKRLIGDHRVDAAIITMDGTDLLDQWGDEIAQWNMANDIGWLLYRHYERHHEAGEFALDPEQAILVISRGQLRPLLDRLDDADKKRMIIIHDEVHGMGTPSLVAALTGRHKDFPYKIGLSATPERAYDAEGNAFVTSELGPVLYEFSLEKAISRGVLAEFDYLPLSYDLTQNDRDRLQAVYAKQGARRRDGQPMSQEEVWTEIARVYKTAEMKRDVFAKYLEGHPTALERAILFVETRDYGAPILDFLHNYTHLYRTYYAEDDRAHLVAFANGEIDCLITCHRISQGIDIRSLKTVVLFASARARLETIQRIGRCLRIEPLRPDKRALVIDFVRPSNEGEALPNADQDRCEWLTKLAKVRKGDSHGA